MEGIDGVPEAKGKAEELEHPKGSDDRSLGNILQGYGDLVVSLL